MGAAYASGTPISELEGRLESADWDDLLTDTSPREDRSFQRKEEDQTRLLKLELGIRDGSIRAPAGAISGQKLDTLVAMDGAVTPMVVQRPRARKWTVLIKAQASSVC